MKSAELTVDTGREGDERARAPADLPAAPTAGRRDDPMNPDLLDKVLSCRDLPTLPAIAMKVIELTGRESVSMKQLAETIQNDQALAAKILRTVNSSLYGLRTRCSSINQAIVMLGLAAVKTLALGFSLVSAIKDSNTEGFDLEAHWRRALHTGIAARLAAAKAQPACAEEAFLGGLLQDVGMVALYQTLGRKYLHAIAPAGKDHRVVARLELEAFELQHADVGALLATRWKLPESLVMPIKYHERATAAPLEHSVVCRAVGLGNIAAELLEASEPADPLRRLYKRAEQWFALSNAETDDLVKAVAAATREVASLLSVPAGAAANADAVLEAAHERMAEIRIPTDEHGTQASPGANSEAVDELTGVASRFQFDRTLVAAFEQCRAGIYTLSAALFDVDGLDEINSAYGREAGDAVLINVAGRLERSFTPLGGIVARYSGGRFAVLLPRIDRATSVRAAEAARAAVSDDPVRLVAARTGAPRELAVSVSAGVATVDDRLIRRFDGPPGLTAVLEQAVKAAQRAGRNTMRVYAPALAA